MTFYGEPKSSRQGKTKSKRHQYRTPAVLDWNTLHPVERLELLTKHDLARQEKQKLELLRGLLTYYHYATTESRHEVLQAEINKINAAANEQRDRHRSQFTEEQDEPQPEAESAPVLVSELPSLQPRYQNQSQPQQQQRFEGLPPEYDDPPAPYDDEPPYDDDDAQTRVINGRHRRGFGGG